MTPCKHCYYERIATQTARDEATHWKTIARTLQQQLDDERAARATQSELPDTKTPRPVRERADRGARGKRNLFGA